MWVDKAGNVYPVPSNNFKRLRCSKFGTHARIRDYVFNRDKFICQKCGVTGERKYPFTTVNNNSFLVIDHKISIRNGGTHNPENLQALCDRCNSSKVKEDIKYGNSRF